MIPLVYIAGKFSAPTREGVEANIRVAEDWGLKVAAMGALPVIPHANTSRPEFEKLQPYTFWIDATLELLTRCDAALFIPGWLDSKGAQGEHAAALADGMRVFYHDGEAWGDTELPELKAWIEKQRSKRA